ncbi:MAG: DNA-protecting protein DprA [Elusimicrobia bacterium]|nr:MAG: DNA-protecting protein DprA [Elusimicrobiota bacterium]
MALIRRLTPVDDEFPQLLLETKDIPAFLTVLGSLPQGCAIAVVGSRKPSVYARRMTRRVAAGLAEAGVIVVSGLARGIDTAAHEAALDAGGITWAVLGSGLKRIYPSENAKLAQRIVAGGGAILSQFEPAVGPSRHHFPMRNKIVSGLCLGVVVVEGTGQSGSLITARSAADQSREVMCVPGPVDTPSGEAVYRLLRDGATPVRNAEDVLEHLGLQSTPLGGSLNLTNEEEGATVAEYKILELLGSNSLTIEELIGETGYNLPHLLSLLSYMEGKGSIVPVAGQGYARS